MEYALLKTLGIVFSLGIFSQWVAWRLRFPVIVLLTGLGILFGPALGIIDPHEALGELLHPLIELAVAIILFEGGLLLKFHEFRKAPLGMMRLFSLAVFINWILGSLAGRYIGGLNWGTSLLIAGILIVTGPTVILPALREAKLNKSTSSCLKWEGIVNDPIGAVIAVLVYEYIVFSGKVSGLEFVMLSIAKIIGISFALSFATRSLFLWFSKRALVPEFLKVPFLVSSILILFILAEHLQKGAGLLTITIFGILIGNSNFSSLRDIKRFGESVSVFTVSAVFIILSASLDLEIWYKLNWQHFVLIFVLAFIIRPVGIMFSTVNSGIKIRERILIALYGPRGIVAASVAGAVGTGLYDVGYGEGEFVLPIIFSVIILTVVVHSFWLDFLAKKLKLKIEGEHGVLIVGASPWSIQLARAIKEKGIPVMVTDTSWHRLAPAKREDIEVHYGHIMDDLDYGEPDISAFEYLIAATEDDHYNTLVCHKLRHVFGSDHVYQIPIHGDFFDHSRELMSEEYCALGNSEKALHENMMRNYHHGWDFKSLVLSEECDLETIQQQHFFEDSIPFMLIKANKRIMMFGKDVVKPAQGDTIVYYSK